MDEKNIKQYLTIIYKDFKKYIELKFDYYRLEVIEKIVEFITKIFSLIIFWIMFPIVLFFALIAFALYLGEILGAYYWGFLIVAGVALLIGFIIFIFRKIIFTNPITNALISAFFSNKQIKRKHEKKKSELSSN